MTWKVGGDSCRWLRGADQVKVIISDRQPSRPARRDQLLQERDRDRTGEESTQTERDLRCLHQRTRSALFSLRLFSTHENIERSHYCFQTLQMLRLYL